MATWTDIPDEVLEPGKPIRSVDALALRDNPIAIAQGAAGAPRIVSGAITSLDAAKLTGTINGARLPTTHGGVGTYAFVSRANTYGRVNWGGTVSGSSLLRASITFNGETLSISRSGALTGTWRVMGEFVSGNTSSTSPAASLAVRIS